MRVGQWGAYYKKDSPYDKFRKAAGDIVMKAWGDRPKITKPVVVSAAFMCSPPATTKLEFPKGDIDNYLKALFDALNKRVWKDDDQVCGCSGRKYWADSKDEARIDVVIRVVQTPWKRKKRR